MITLLLAIFLHTGNSQAAPISDATFLRKVSFHIRGMAPTPQEYKTLAQQDAAGRPKYLEKKIKEYLASPEAQDRMVFRLAERFQMKTSEIDATTFRELLPNDRSMVRNYEGYGRDSLTEMFASIARDNLSWDTLLTAKKYLIFPKTSYNYNPTDFAFYRTYKPDLISDDNSPSNNIFPTGIPVNFPDNDLRVSGAITTPRFIGRYTTTNVNKNRRRAAAVFRIFLCDPMVPVIPPPPDRKGNALGNAFPDEDHGSATEEDLANATTIPDSARHGSDKRCATCHYKLDPLGRTFQNIGTAFNPHAAQGALTYMRANGELFFKPLRGIGELGEEIVKQPEYVDCQIEWFWKQFIGSDVVLKPERKAELRKTFESVDRRANDFIQALVLSPEFRNPPPKLEKVVFAQVEPLLRRCDKCHSGEGYIDDFSNGKIGFGTFREMRYRLNLPDSHKDSMPRDRRNWDPKDLEVVKRWIDEGAMGPEGKLLFDPSGEVRP